MWGLTGARMFSPLGVSEKDKIYYVMILTLQCAYFGPFPDKYVKLSNVITIEHLHGIKGLVAQRERRIKYRNTLASHFCKKTMNFLDRFMQLDPRDRPSAQDLLQDQWLSDVPD